ncbi:TPA: L,D-transpeptidase [Streptococcus equi subsp. zooepidemicus]|uniref:L,D-transpeptidase n=1 Tax=Streptococcus equi TaxID=1336 RepID=UPI000DA2E349|nr:L,D-transpeptidase [Streptococcus equi]SQF82138.1 cell surface protein ErfK family [Streptococcus equi subsp. zooepidemicus]HEL0560939.1 L,D-transpeptidase [Streptococcus equi subsp. zooepidemicus]HEL0610218.1 L,D-transpeptidase [Streptococcus equi subsp. zooepidemicus]HEL0652001.1 L,D-transpeptidase [Streptococcus equi subsp. zooepidemicus]HEL0693807.1 L,D-transpeptidase [Streptococcus equi subsp. zooepidemicus]
MKKRVIGMLGVLIAGLVIGLVWWQGSTADQSSKPAKEVMTTAETKASVPHKEKMESKEPETLHQPEAYPDLASYQELSVHVSIADQVMTIIGDGKVVFKTSVSTGAKESPTPTGTFVIEPERGDFFFNHESGEGAYYWVSFKDHGIYLFHSLPTDQYGNEIPEEAEKLGQPASHGCVRMSRADAKWFYDNIPEGISVIIK